MISYFLTAISAMVLMWFIDRKVFKFTVEEFSKEGKAGKIGGKTYFFLTPERLEQYGFDCIAEYKEKDEN